MNREELEKKFAEAQAGLVESFKHRLRSAHEEVLGNLYTDVVNYAAEDAHVNYHNYLRDEFRASLIEEVTSKYGQWSWAHSCRMKILEKHKDVLQNKIIEDLQEQVKSLENQIEQLRRYR